MPAVQSVFSNSSLCDVICAFSPWWHRRERMKGMLEAMHVWATDEKLRLLHLFVVAVHQEQKSEVVGSRRGLMRMVGFTRYLFSSELHDEEDDYPFYLPDEDAWMVHIPESIMYMAQATVSDLDRYVKLLGLYGMKSRFSRPDDCHPDYRLVIGRSSFGPVLAQCYERVQVSTAWLDYTARVEPNTLDRLYNIPGLHMFGGKDDLRDLARIYRGCVAPGRSPPTSASTDYDRGTLGSIMYGCARDGLGAFQRSVIPFLFSALLLDPGFMGMMHLVFTPVRRHESDFMFLRKTQRVADLCASYREESLGSTDRSLYEMADACIDRVLCNSRSETYFRDKGEQTVGLELRCSPALHVIMSTFAQRLDDADMSNVTFTNYPDTLVAGATPGNRVHCDLADAIALLINAGDTLVDFMTYRTTVHVKGFARDNQVIMMSSNGFMLEVIGHCYPLAIFPSFSGRTVNPCLKYFVPFPYIKDDSERRVYSVPESISQPGAHVRLAYNDEIGPGDAYLLMDLVMHETSNTRDTCTYDMRCPVFFSRMAGAGDPTLRGSAPKGKDLLDVFCGAPLIGKKRVYPGDESD